MKINRAHSDFMLKLTIKFNLNWILIMAKIKRTVSDKEKKLLDIIADAQSKLAALQEKQKMDLGELAYKNGLNEFDLNVMDEEFKKLSVALANREN